MAKKLKLRIIRARVSAKMKRQIIAIAVQAGEAEAVILRKALNEYIEAQYKDEPPTKNIGFAAALK